MAMARKIPKEVQAIFDKYIQQKTAKRLKKADAIHMLETEFGLSASQAEQMFETFDKDQNGYFSLWEFQQFYACVGNAAADMVKKFEEMDVDKSGKLSMDEAWAGMRTMKTATGQPLEDRDIELLLRASVGDDGNIDLGHFATLLFRLKLYKPPPKKN